MTRYATCFDFADILAGFNISAAVVKPKVVLIFEPSSAAEAESTKEYETIWMAEGNRIINALESRTGLTFQESEIRVVIAEVPSSSGFGSEPMKLRASYPTSTKKATLIHELGHRLQSRFFKKDEEDHPYLFHICMMSGSRFMERSLQIIR